MSMSRRQFLRHARDLTMLGGTLAIRHLLSPSLVALAARTTQVDVPPSLMFHARWKHKALLPKLLDMLRDKGYSGITYQQLYQSTLGLFALPPKPIILSLDDVTMVKGAPAFETFKAMIQICQTKGFSCVLGVNTYVERAQEEQHWMDILALAKNGMLELANHTDTHLDLTRKDVSLETLRQEITKAAKMLQERSGQPTTTLILPFGKGYNRTKHYLFPLIEQLCIEAGIVITVGIAGGREPVSVESGRVAFMGRVPPGVNLNETATSAMYAVEHWHITPLPSQTK